MADNGANASGKQHPNEDGNLWDQLRMMRAAFMHSPVRGKIFLLGGTIFLLIVATSLAQILLNRWNQPFYDAVARRDLADFFHQLLVFAAIAVALLVLNIGQTWFNWLLRLKLREGLTLDLIEQWMVPGRAFKLAHAGVIGVNPDQRMQQDADHLTDLSSSLGVGLLQSTILLFSFVGVLWSLSAGFTFQFHGRSFAIPGYMVWAAIIYAGSASWLSWLVGRPLIRLNAERYQRESELRFSMMRVNEDVDAISLARGEADERRRLELDLTDVLQALRRIFVGQVHLLWVTDSYGWVTVVAPIIIAAPVYFSGDLTFGGLMMAVGAFNQVHSSLRWFINNINAIADWRATLLRVADFRSAIVKTDVLHGNEKRIEFAPSEEDRITFENLRVSSPGGCIKLADTHVVVAPGEKVIMIGDPGVGKTLFFRAIAGLWPWGSGRIEMPASDKIAFVPRTPYFPPGTLRSVLCYPRGETSFNDEALVAALDRIGLKRLKTSLDRVARWDRELSDGDQRLLAFARLYLHKPRFVIIDEALDMMETGERDRVLALLSGDLSDSAVINIGRGERNGHFFTRKLHLVKDVEGRALRPVRLKHAGPEAPTLAEADAAT
ncbi:MAG TPA: ABC transporter ATP-binding protein/permease [Rhizobiaceae bacterium]|nr:ABC transporter ATP-binding protein/permease [Rhizobiaceae bacterium]